MTSLQSFFTFVLSFLFDKVFIEACLKTDLKYEEVQNLDALPLFRNSFQDAFLLSYLPD